MNHSTNNICTYFETDPDKRSCIHVHMNDNDI